MSCVTHNRHHDKPNEVIRQNVASAKNPYCRQSSSSSQICMKLKVSIDNCHAKIVQNRKNLKLNDDGKYAIFSDDLLATLHRICTYLQSQQGLDRNLAKNLSKSQMLKIRESLFTFWLYSANAPPI